METWRDRSLISLTLICLLFHLSIAGCGHNSFESHSTFQWEVGQWVRYETNLNGDSERSMKGTPPPIRIEFSLVGHEKESIVKRQTQEFTAPHEKLFWLEIYEEFPETTVLLKLLVPEKMKGEPKRILIQNGSSEIVEMTDTKHFFEEIWKGMEFFQETDLFNQNTEGNKETINLPAGIFETHSVELEIEKEKVTLWSSEIVPIWGVAKMSSNGMEIVLTDYGLSGAISRMKDSPIVAGIFH